MNVRRTVLPEVMVVEPRCFPDNRGYFMESYNAGRYAEAGIADTFVQDNLSFSSRGVLRGLHFQHPFDQAKLVHALQGEIFDVAVDVRVGSPNFGRWVGEVLSAGNRRQLYIPTGFAHGFVVLSETALVSYKCSETYRPEAEQSVLWSDRELGIKWPIDDVILSVKDAAAAPLLAIDRGRLPGGFE
jgi:dTDP-4-dehydrorhamnose 3,5-epimerase